MSDTWVRIRRTTPADREAVLRVHRLAFAPAEGPPPHDGSVPEAVLVEELWADGDTVPALDLVAESDGDVVGHVVVSRASMGAGRSLGLGPIGVLPERQGEGIGSALMRSVLAAAEELGEPSVVLLGHPGFYPRFGFEPAVDHGVTPPQDWGREYFMVLRLPAWQPAMAGPFRYAPAFERL